MALLSWLDFLFHSSSILMAVPCFDLFPVVVTATDFEITISRFSIPATLISRIRAQFSPALFSQTRTVRCHPAFQQDCILFVDIKRLTQVPSILVLHCFQSSELIFSSLTYFPWNALLVCKGVTKIRLLSQCPRTRMNGSSRFPVCDKSDFSEHKPLLL